MKRASAITWTQLRVGLVIVAALAIMTLAVYKLGQAANLFAPKYDLLVFLNNANGLINGGEVTVAGEIAGSIKTMDLLPPTGDTSRNLKIVLSVDRKLQPQIRRDSKAYVRTQGLLGDKILDISPGTPRYPVLQPGDTLPVAKSLDYEAVLAQAAGAVGDVVALTRDLRQITSGLAKGQGTMGLLLTNRTLYDQLTGTLGRTNALIEHLQNPNGTFGRMLEDPTLYNHLVSTIASTDSLVVSLNNRKGSLGKLVSDTLLYNNLVGITRGADSLVTMMNHGSGFASKMLTDQRLYDQLTKLVTDMAAVFDQMQRDPQKYFKGLIKVF